MSAEDYIQELLDEKDRLDPSRSLHSIRLLEDEIHRVRVDNEGTRDYPPPPQRIMNNVQYKEEVIKLVEKIVLPTEEYPKFNFVGKIIGPKGSTLKGIQASTKAKLSILGRGSTRDREKEEELSKSDDPKFEHFKEPLHVLIQVEAPRSDAHARLADALDEINKCMAPDNEDRYERIQEVAFHGNHMGQKFNGVGRGLPVPIIRVGIPPPGAIVLNEQPRIAHRSPRVGGHVERPRFRSAIPY